MRNNILCALRHFVTIFWSRKDTYNILLQNLSPNRDSNPHLFGSAIQPASSGSAPEAERLPGTPQSLWNITTKYRPDLVYPYSEPKHYLKMCPILAKLLHYVLHYTDWNVYSTPYYPSYLREWFGWVSDKLLGFTSSYILSRSFFRIPNDCKSVFSWLIFFIV